jgi:phage terminase small subunit
MLKDTLTPPQHLRPPTQTWWTSVVSEFVLEPHHIRLLSLACTAWDRAEECQEAISLHGLTYESPTGPKLRPEAQLEKDSRIGFARLLRELDLDIDAPNAASRPPALRSNTPGLKVYNGR